jgi:protein-tyrosine-phosphatase
MDGRGRGTAAATPIQAAIRASYPLGPEPHSGGLARAAFARLDISVHSAGLSPRPLDPRAVGVMSRIGLDIDDVVSTPVRELELASFEFVVSLGIHKLV